MTLYIDNRTTFEWEEKWEEVVRKAVRTSLDYEGFEIEDEVECEISVSIVTNNEIQKLNKEFRNIDKATDVLSFPQLTLTVHSMLHLMGYDHMEVAEEKEMIKKQKEILQQVGFII